MAKPTVSDIDGKDFKFELTVQERQPISPTGTIFGTVGVAKWGAVNSPLRISGGEKEFLDVFGTPLTASDNAPDASALAMQYHLQNSQLGLYTRISDGTDAKASLDIISTATVAKFVGTEAIQGTSVVIYPQTEPLANNRIELEIKNGAGSPTTIDFNLTATPKADDIVSGDLSTYTGDTDYDYSQNESISFSVDGIVFTHIIPATSDDFKTLSTIASAVTPTGDLTTGTKVVSTVSSLTGVKIGMAVSGASIAAGTTIESIDTVAGTITLDTAATGTATGETLTITETYAQKWVAAASKALPLAAPYLSGVGNKVTFSSGKRGTASKISVNSTTDIMKIFSSAPEATTSANTPILDVVNEIKSYVLTAVGSVSLSAESISISSATPALASYVEVQTVAAVGQVSTHQLGIGDGVKTSFTYEIPNYEALKAASTVNILSGFEVVGTYDVDGNSFTDVNGITTGSCSFSAGTFTIVFSSAVPIGTVLTLELETSLEKDAYGLIGIDASQLDVQVNGTDTQQGISFLAAYTGTDGNTLYAKKNIVDGGNILSIYFRSTLVAQFINYSYDPASTRYLPTLLADEQLTDYFTFTAPTVDIGNTLPPIPEDVALYFEGGSNGTATLNDDAYISAIQEYANGDLFEVDLIAIPERTSVLVADKLQEICKERQDCIAIVDPPEGLTINGVINWHNGNSTGLREKALNDWQVVTYYPWVYIPTNNGLEWHSPSVRAIGAIAASDAQRAKVAAPAGLRTQMSDVEAIQTTLSKKDRNKLYSDSQNHAVNPIGFTLADGFTIEGQKTTSRDKNALNRINVARTVTEIKKEIDKIIKFFFWEPANPETWGEFKVAISKILGQKYVEEAIQGDYTVTIDETNNTSEIIANNGLIAELSFTPVYTIEKIKVVATLREEGAVIQVS